MTNDRRGKSVLPLVMGDAYPFGLMRDLAAQQPSHFVIDEAGSFPRWIGLDYADHEARSFDFASALNNPNALRSDMIYGGAKTMRSTDSRGLDKWIRFAESYGFKGALPEMYAHEAERREIEAREFGWLAAQRECAVIRSRVREERDCED